MCTSSWWLANQEFHLLFNRDELLSRRKALTPQLRPMSDGPGQILAPIDADAGGTWLGASSSGLLTCLLNYYPFTHRLAQSPALYRSRGQIIPLLLSQSERGWHSRAGTGESQSSGSLLATWDLHLYRPFSLLYFDFGCREEYCGFRSGWMQWDGRQLRSQDNAPQLLSSSSCFSPQVEKARLAHFTALQRACSSEQHDSRSPAALRELHLRYHCGHQPLLYQSQDSSTRSSSIHREEGDAASVCMHRSAAVAGPAMAGATVSLTHVTVWLAGTSGQGQSKLQMDYFAGAPCQAFGPDWQPTTSENWYSMCLLLTPKQVLRTKE